MERLGSGKWLENFEKFRNLKKVEKPCSKMYYCIIMKASLATASLIFTSIS